MRWKAQHAKPMSHQPTAFIGLTFREPPIPSGPHRETKMQRQPEQVPLRGPATEHLQEPQEFRLASLAVCHEKVHSAVTRSSASSRRDTTRRTPCTLRSRSFAPLTRRKMAIYPLDQIHCFVPDNLQRRLVAVALFGNPLQSWYHVNQRSPKLDDGDVRRGWDRNRRSDWADMCSAPSRRV